MQLRAQSLRTFWLALAHALLFHTDRHYSKREQTARARHLRQRVTHYICDWKRNGFRMDGFQPGQGGAATIEEYCWALKTHDHSANSNRQLELQAFSEIYSVRLVCYDASTNRPDWKAHPWRSAGKAAATVRFMRDKHRQWRALYPGNVAPSKVLLPRARPGPYGSCKRLSQCEPGWTCVQQRMCLPDGAVLPTLPPL